MRVGWRTAKRNLANLSALPPDALPDQLESMREAFGIVRSTCRFGEGRTAIRITRDTEPNDVQARAYALIEADDPWWKNKRAQ